LKILLIKSYKRELEVDLVLNIKDDNIEEDTSSEEPIISSENESTENRSGE
jgi:hypothetical protein